jgi:DNA-directed RNA polymerase subunit RPC12/RpoP
VIYVVFKYWWVAAPVVVIPVALLVMSVAGLRLRRVACVDCGGRRLMLAVAAAYRCDRCKQKQAEAAAEERREFQKWSWHPLMPMPPGFQSTPARSGFSPGNPPPPYTPPGASEWPDGSAQPGRSNGA